MSDLAVDGFGHWLAGFIDGEGSFMILAYQDPRGRERYRLRFRLALRDDDFSVLAEIIERTGIGEIVYASRRPPWGDVASWQVRRQSDLEALCLILDRYPLRAKKQADYEVWREAVASAGRMYRGYGGGGAEGGCDTWLWLDAATNAEIKVNGIGWYVADQPLRVEAKPITVKPG